MKQTNLRKKTISLSIVSLAIILGGAFYLGRASSANNSKGGGIITYAEATPFEKQKHEKELELKKVLGDYDKNIVYTSVFLGSADEEITYANIFIVSNEDITNEDELKTLASESLDLDIKDIEMQYMDVETFTSQGKIG